MYIAGCKAEGHSTNFTHEGLFCICIIHHLQAVTSQHWWRFGSDRRFSLPSTGGIETFLHAVTGPRESAQTGKLHPRQLNVIPLHFVWKFNSLWCTVTMAIVNAIQWFLSEISTSYTTTSPCGGSGWVGETDTEWMCLSFPSCCNASDEVPCFKHSKASFVLPIVPLVMLK